MNGYAFSNFFCYFCLIMSKSRFILSPVARKTLFSVLLVGLGVFAIASMGGGNKSKDKTAKPEFVPIRTTSGFTLKAGPVYRGSINFGQQKTKELVAFNSLVTYQKGNTVYILPGTYKVQIAPATNSTLQLLNLRLKMHK